MKAASNDEHAIRRKAAELITRRDAGWTEEEAAEFALWRAADPRHDAAVRRIEATQRMLSRLPDVGAAAEMERELHALYRGPRRKAWGTWVTLGALAAAACISLLVWFSAPSAALATFAASIGQNRTVDLSDGSTLQLGGGSRVDVNYAANERRVTLQSGEVHFSVAKDATRPFIVSAGHIRVRAVGTAFNVRRTSAQVQVVVTEGKVQVTEEEAPVREHGAALSPMFLVAGESATIDSAGAQVATTRRISRAGSVGAAAWSAPRLEFSNTPLSEVVERFNEFSRVQLEIGDEIGRAHV